MKIEIFKMKDMDEDFSYKGKSGPSPSDFPLQKNLQLVIDNRIFKRLENNSYISYIYYFHNLEYMKFIY